MTVYSRKEVEEMALARMWSRVGTVASVMLIFSVLNWLQLGWQSGLWALLNAGLILGAGKLGTGIGKTVPTTKRMRSVIFYLGSLLVAAGFVLGYSLWGSGFWLIACVGPVGLVLISTISTAITSSKFCHLSDADVEVVNANPAKLGHPFW